MSLFLVFEHVLARQELVSSKPYTYFFYLETRAANILFLAILHSPQYVILYPWGRPLLGWLPTWQTNVGLLTTSQETNEHSW